MVRMVVNTEDGDVEVVGTLLAQASSRKYRHSAHSGSRYAPAKTRCSACRWTRITLIKQDDSEERPYVIVTEGFSLVPGETVLGRVERTSSPLWVIEYLHRRSKDKKKYLPVVARNALLMAVQFDEKLARECEIREVNVGPSY